MSTPKNTSALLWRCLMFFLLVSVTITMLSCNVQDNQRNCDLVPVAELRVRSTINPDLSSAIRRDVNAIFVRAQEAYVGFGNSVIILDVTNPADPKLISSISLPVDEVLVLQVIGDYLYVNWPDLTGGMYIIDVSDPLYPIEVDCQEENSFQLSSATLSGDYAYLPLGDVEKGGLLIYDVTNPRKVVEVGAYQPEPIGRPVFFPNLSNIDSSQRIVTSVGISGDYAYVGENLPGGDSIYNGQLRILDISIPENPRLVGIYNMPYQTGITDIVAGDKYVFASASGWIVNHELTTILDISDPASPIELHQFSTDLLATSFGNFVYFIDSGNIVIWDVSDPSSPAEVGSIDIPPTVYVGTNDIVISGDYLYVAMQDEGLQIFNNTNPSKPVKISTFPQNN
jgi:hypothetical protein